MNQISANIEKSATDDLIQKITIFTCLILNHLYVNMFLTASQWDSLLHNILAQALFLWDGFHNQGKLYRLIMPNILK